MCAIAYKPVVNRVALVWKKVPTWLLKTYCPFQGITGERKVTAMCVATWMSLVGWQRGWVTGMAVTLHGRAGAVGGRAGALRRRMVSCVEGLLTCVEGPVPCVGGLKPCV